MGADHRQIGHNLIELGLSSILNETCTFRGSDFVKEIGILVIDDLHHHNVLSLDNVEDG